jgi:tyrosyl-tRNA synthetase
MMISVKEQIRIISKGAAEVINIEDLEIKLQRAIDEKKPLIVKLGLDPSAPDIHLGHAVVLRKLKQFQELGHRVVIVIGDFTGMIGDPTGKSKTRRQLTREEVLDNAETYEKQIFKILDKSKTEVRFNSEWLSKLNFKDVLELSAKYTVARMLEREDFKNRFEKHESIGIHEFFYPLMQGFDSIALEADVELGGTDQRFNVLMGRTLQRDYDQKEQVALFMPLLEGLDGKNKMSKSLNNYVGINEASDIMFEKIMTVPDELIIKYYELATDIHPDLVDRVRKELLEGKRNPRDIKMELAKEITILYHGENAGIIAEEHFKTVFQKKEIPTNIPEFKIENSQSDNKFLTIIEILTNAHILPNRSEAKRLVEQGAIKVNSEKILDIKKNDFKNNDIIQIGKGRFLRLNIVLSERL